MSIKDVFLKIEQFIYSDGWRIAGFFAILFFGIILVRFFGTILKKLLLKGTLSKTLGILLCSLAKFFLYLILLFVLAGYIGINLQPLTTLLLSAGLAVSLALQDSLSNVANGMIIVSTKPFTVGDYVQVGDVDGVVRKIGLIFTEIITFDNKKITVPNTKIMSDKVINFSARPTRRVDIVVSVSKDSDLQLVKDTLFATLKAESKTLDEPPPMVNMARHTADSFDFNARAWVKTEDYWDVLWALNEQIVISFRSNNITMPFKAIDIMLKNKKTQGESSCNSCLHTTNDDITSTSQND